MLAWALLVHLKSSRVDPYQTSRLDSLRHPMVTDTLEAHTEDTRNPRVVGHVVGPILHQQAQVEGAAVTQHMQLEKVHPLSLPGLQSLAMAGEVKQQLKSIVPVYPPDTEEPVVDDRKLVKPLGRHSCGGNTRFEPARETQLGRLA